MNFKTEVSSGRTVSSDSELRFEELTVEPVRDLSELDTRGDDWNRLAMDAPQHLPMLSYTWVKTYFEFCLAPEEKWIVLFAYKGQKLVGVLPLVIREYGSRGSGKVDLAAPFDWHTVSVDLLSDEKDSQMVVRALLKSLSNFVPNWRRLELKRIPETSPTVRILNDRPENVYCLIRFNGIGLINEIKGTFDEFLARLGHNYRAKLRKAQRKIKSLPDVKTVIIKDSTEIKSALESFFQLEGSGWKGEMKSAVINSERLANFYRSLFSRLAEIGWVELSFLKTEGETMAAILAVKMGRYGTGLKIAYNNKFVDFSPGVCFTAEFFERAFAQGDIDIVDCLNDSEWLRHWRLTARKYYDITMYPRRFFPAVTQYIPGKLILGIKNNNGIRKIFRKRAVL